jgi:hypothetical protein
MVMTMLQMHDSAVVSGLRCLREHRLQSAPFPAPRVLVSDLCAAAAAADRSCVSCGCHRRQRCSATTAAPRQCSTPCSCSVKHSRSRRRRRRHQQPATKVQEAQGDLSTTPTPSTLFRSVNDTLTGVRYIRLFFILSHLRLPNSNSN